jgi:hypothetical protein
VFYRKKKPYKSIAKEPTEDIQIHRDWTIHYWCKEVNNGGNQKIPRIKWKWKYKLTEPLG